MFRLQTILFPVDFSERSIGAGRYVRALAEHFHAELILLHVVEPSTYDRAAIDKVAVRRIELQLFLADGLRSIRVKRLVLEGDPTRKIVETALTEKADLIMMPTHGWGVYRRFILGSVTAKVLHDAGPPVWTCVNAEQAPRGDVIECRRILCAVDLGPGSGRVLEQARDLGRAYNAAVTVTHVCQTVEEQSVLVPGDGGVNQHLVARSSKSLAFLCEQAGCAGVPRVEAGDIAETVQKMAREMSSDILVIGRSGECASGRLRSTAYSIIRQSPCPVISV